jgi:hypothetical protein
MVNQCTAAIYVTVGSNVDPCSHVISLLNMTSDGHQDIADLGWYNSQEGIFMCVKVTLHCDLPIEMTKPEMQL